MKNKVRTLLIWVLLLALFFVAYQAITSGDRGAKTDERREIFCHLHTAGEVR